MDGLLMSHLRQVYAIAAAFTDPVVDRAWCWFHRRLQSSADREAQRFLRYHPNAQIRSSR